MGASAQQVISKGAIRRIFAGDIGADEKPIVQVLQIKSIPAQGNAPERHRVVLNDSENFVQSMIATQSNHLVTSGKLKKGVLIRMNQYTPSLLKDRQIMVLLAFEVLEEYGELEKLGTPQSLDSNTSAPAQPAPQAAAATNFYGNKPAAQPAPRAAPSAPSYGGQSSSGGNSGKTNIYPIEGLSPFQNKWTIKARVSFKSEVKTWRNAKGEGKLFTVNFLDESGEIRATGFNEQCNELYDVLQEGQVYYVSRCRVGPANRKFSTLSNDYELTFERDTEVQKCEDESSVPQVKYNFVPFANLTTVEPNAIVDVVGVIKEIGESSNITSKASGKEFAKREITLVDSSGYSVRLTVWGNSATSFDLPMESVVAFKGVKVSDFGGRSLSALMSSQMVPNPDIEEAHKLKGWWDGAGKVETFASHYGMSGATGGARDEKFLNLQEVKDSNLGMDESKVDWFSTKATVAYVKQENPFYPACMSENCNKKVINMDDGTWRCEKCDRGWPKPQYRYILLLSCYDAFGTAYLNCFDDVGKLILGMDADQLHELQENDNDAFTQVFLSAACKTFTFRCKAKMEIYQDQQRIRYSVYNASPVDYVKWSHKFIEQIKLYD